MLNSIPPHFRATITGSTLEISSGTHDARVIVRNSSNVQVLDRRFVGGTALPYGIKGSDVQGRSDRQDDAAKTNVAVGGTATLGEREV